MKTIKSDKKKHGPREALWFATKSFIKKYWFFLLALIVVLILIQIYEKSDQIDIKLLTTMQVKSYQDNSVVVMVDIYSEAEQYKINNFELEADIIVDLTTKAKSYLFEDYFVSKVKKGNDPKQKCYEYKFIFPDIRARSVRISPSRPNLFSERSKTFFLNFNFGFGPPADF